MPQDGPLTTLISSNKTSPLSMLAGSRAFASFFSPNKRNGAQVAGQPQMPTREAQVAQMATQAKREAQREQVARAVREMQEVKIEERRELVMARKEREMQVSKQVATQREREIRAEQMMARAGQLVSGGELAVVREREQRMPPVFRPKPEVQPHPIPKLPLFDEVARRLSTIVAHDTDKTVAVSRQHHLASTIKMYEFLKSLNMKVHASGKVYSSNPSVEATMVSMGVHLVPVAKSIKPGYYHEASEENAKELWRQVCTNLSEIKRIVILSDGGDLFEAMPKHLQFAYSMAGAEQTRGGLYSVALQEELFPIVDVASSAAKREIESPLIAAAIVKKVVAHLPELATNKKLVCGIIGNGYIGYALAEYLLRHGYIVMIYDENRRAFAKLRDKQVPEAPSIKSLISGSDYIFGCTGTDVTYGISPFLFEGKKVYVNCASGDREFRTALRQSKIEPSEYNPLEDVTVKNIQGEMTFMYGGFPINFAPMPKFDANSGKKVIPQHTDPSCLPLKDIELTQSLLALGITQALLNSKKVVGYSYQQRQCLDPYGQRYIVTEWLQRNGGGRYPKTLMENFQNIDWITKSSGGVYVPNSQLRRCFENVPLHDVPFDVNTFCPTFNSP